MGFDFNKYNPNKKPPLSDWTESAPVVALSEYLKQHRASGIRLANDNGITCLLFQPGFTSNDIGSPRWCIAIAAETLLMDAAADLQELLSAGKINVPESPHRMVK